MSRWQLGRYVVRADWGHILGVTGIYGFCVWYFFDVLGVSSRIENILMVAPATAVATVLYLVIVIRDITVQPTDSPAGGGALRDTPAAGVRDKPPFLLMAMLVAYVLLLPVIGFDIATALFVFLALFATGRKDWRFAAVYAALFALLTVGALQSLLSVPIPTSILSLD